MRAWLLTFGLCLACPAILAAQAEDESVDATPAADEPNTDSEDRAPNADSENREPNADSEAREPTTDSDDREPTTDSDDREPDADSAPDDPYADATVADDYPSETEQATMPDEASEAPTLRYYFEGVRIRGNESTRASVIRHYVPFEEGDVLDPRSEELEDIEWRLRGTGWFSQVEVSLARGSRRGWVVIVIEVEERNTIVVSQLVAGISEGLRRTEDSSSDAVPYLGFTVAETNLAGTGARLGLSVLGSTRAQALRLEYDNPTLLPRGWRFGALGFFNNGRHYFGDGNVFVDCFDEETGMLRPDCDEEFRSKNIVVFYRRAGLALTTGHALGPNTRLQLGYQVEMVKPIGNIPTASLSYGRDPDNRRPFIPNIEEDLSWLSVLRTAIEYDKRNDPTMTTRGVFFRLDGELASSALGSSYEFLRVRTTFRAWAPLPWSGHSLRFSLFLGSVFGDAPFFYQFQIADLTDLVPSQVFEMQLDRRGAPNLLGTAIADMRVEELAGRFDIQYELPLFRGGRRLRRLNAYFNIGLLYLADPRALQLAVPGYSGAAAAPIDLTFDVGLRFDSRIGVFQIGFSNILGFLNLFDR
ncbi:MAG: BamA/TamA family outer membrane protein [Deltaproteobacteria bacterium]|nr:BamA/TamA family outer membrane protein [Deltaproteobacteria bacterium]